MQNRDIGARSPSLTERSLHGFAWLFGQSVVTHLVGFCGQIALAWLLAPSAFGLIAIARSVQVFTALAQQNGVRKILVARQNEYAQLANPGFWYSLTTGLLAGLLMAAAAPIAAATLGHPELNGLILIMALAAPFQGLTPVCLAKLSIDLRFGPIAIIHAASLCTQMALTVLLAWLGFGVYSFALPLLVTSPGTALAFWLLTRPPLRLALQVSYWRSLLGMSGIMFSIFFLNKIVGRGGYLILGANFTAAVVGIYFLAFSLSQQFTALFANNLTNVLFPSFSKLSHDPRRHRAAFIRSARLLALFTIPISIYVAVIAEPLIRLLFDDKWLPSIPILRILAAGTSLNILSGLCNAYLQSQGRFPTVLIINVIRCALFLTATLTAVQFGLLWFAAAAITPSLVSPFLFMFFSMGFSRDTCAAIVRILALPLLLSGVMATVSLPLLAALPDTAMWDAVAPLIVGAGFTLFLIGAVRLFADDLWKEMETMWRQIFKGRRFGQRAVTSTGD